MNKKIIAIAIAAAMSAPVMADVTVGGQIGASMVMGSKQYTQATAGSYGATAEDATKTSRTIQDSGLTKIEFNITEGNAIAKIGLDARPVFGGGSPAGRDFWLGYKFGSSGTVSAGRMPSAVAGLEGDKYNATFLEMRRTAAVSSTDNTLTDSYTASPVLQYAVKAGSAAIKVQYDATDNASDTTSSGSEGYTAVSVKGQAGAVGYFVGYNNGSGKDVSTNKESNTKVGASMKFGAAKVTAMMMNSDSSGTKEASTAIMADMGLGNGLAVDFVYGMKTEGTSKKDTFMRLAVSKNLTKKSKVFGGYVAERDDNGTTKDTNAFGFGMVVKF